MHALYAVIHALCQAVDGLDPAKGFFDFLSGLSDLAWSEYRVPGRSLPGSALRSNATRG